MDQKNTIFCRLLWDRELVQKIEASIDPSGLLAVFTVAWLLSCILEGESRAAGMGILVFGVPTVIVFAWTRKRIVRGTKSRIEGE